MVQRLYRVRRQTAGLLGRAGCDKFGRGGADDKGHDKAVSPRGQVRAQRKEIMLVPEQTQT